LAPTRELALQTKTFLNKMGKFVTLRAACLVGGDALEEQFDELAKNPDVLVATPGR
jgi:ATP-dependent RNA helicase DDX54/DBP10